VTDVLRPLQDANLIRSQRGKISILDGAGLEERSRECYRAVKATSDRLLGVGESPLSYLSSTRPERLTASSTCCDARRTPRINGSAGRDHWGACSAVLAGGGRQHRKPKDIDIG
jgi:hypothetical protein